MTVDPPKLIAAAVFAAICLGFHAFSEQGWVPILDSFNLALHEAGHPLTGMLSQRLMVYGGTLFQIVFPVALIVHFRRAGHDLGAAIGGIWLGENLLNIARYMADAQAQALPLVGGGEHDWTEILSRWGLLQKDYLLARITRVIGTGIVLAALVWLVLRWRQDMDE